MLLILGLLDIGSEENSVSFLTSCNDSYEEPLSVGEGNLSSTFLSEKYINGYFMGEKDTKHQEVSQVLRHIRIKNINKVIIGM